MLQVLDTNGQRSIKDSMYVFFYTFWSPVTVCLRITFSPVRLMVSRSLYFYQIAARSEKDKIEGTTLSVSSK